MKLLQTDMPPNIADIHKRRQRQRRGQFLGQLRSPLAIRLPLFDPDRFLSATQFLVRPFYGWFGLTLWVLTVTSALILLGVHWKELTLNLADRVLAMENLFLQKR